MPKTTVFIDSNIWFSAFYKEGVCSKLLRKLTDSSCEIIVSELVLEETIRNIKQKIPDVLSSAVAYLDKIKPTVVKNPKLTKLRQYHDLTNKKDLPILVSALEYKCKFFITGNIKDFKVGEIKKKTGLRILKPSEFIKSIK